MQDAVSCMIPRTPSFPRLSISSTICDATDKQASRRMGNEGFNS